MTPGDASAWLNLTRRPVADASGLPATMHPVVRRVLAARGVTGAADCDYQLGGLLPPTGLQGLDEAAALVASAVADDTAICIAGDYDADGATSTALLMRGLRALGARRLDHVVPDRFTMGYGLSTALADAAHERGAELLITVDSGISSMSGVAHAQARGMRVVITDHHLPGEAIPSADAIVNPNNTGDAFPSKCLAGVGVAFYLLAAVRARIGRDRLNIAELLDLVALGTVADVVPLDRNNRILVAQGLARIRAGRACPGIRALLEVGGRDAATADAATLGFVVGPRLNAAGRLENMGQGVDCLLCDDPEQARTMARELDRLNRERRDIETVMVDGADAARVLPDALGLCLYQSDWHEGVVGLVASRAKQSAHRPVIAFAPSSDAGWLKGSARSIPGLHIRDAIAEADRMAPGLVARFGGHAMAAGLTLPADALAPFAEAFDSACRAMLRDEDLVARIASDGRLTGDELAVETALALEAAGPWGQGFPEPVFDGIFRVAESRVVGERHARYRLENEEGGPTHTAIDFGGAERMAERGARVAIAYQLGVNRWRGRVEPQLIVQALAAAG
ncbi:single-stranded-DNA-specific exonuclease RecJ [Algiphilus sp.]|uniref:single-stranded-DNA-specific exonuclease RecJ n=1 Tax=Algiphilus sp. TaxID=1872431 RepID=UPI0025BF03F6|nr:single-stranded-DNA-specific exonuclease RecJ [Algiphilus sp.]